MAKRKKRKLRKVIVGLILLAVVGGTIASMLFRNKDVSIAVEVAKVGRRDITEVVVANGRVQPVLQVKISPEVSGEIIELAVVEGQKVQKGDLLLRIKPDFYIASRNSAEASYKSSLSDKITAEANLRKAEAEFKRNDELFKQGLISESVYADIETSYEVAQANVQSSIHRVAMSEASLERAEEELLKTTIVAPIEGTVSQLNSKQGERVVGTAQQAGTDVMTIVDLDEMEARVDIGERDIVLIALGQQATLEVDAFQDREFSGVVTEIANAARNAGASSGGQNQDAIRFEVKIRVQEAAPFRPGMSVTADVETRYRTNVVAVPIAAVTTRPASSVKSSDETKNHSSTNETAAVATVGAKDSTDEAMGANEPVTVVFVVEGDVVRPRPVTLGVSDNGYYEIESGLEEGEEIVVGGFLAISRELEDGRLIRRSDAGGSNVTTTP